MQVTTHELKQARRFGAQLAKDGASEVELADAAEDAYGAQRELLSAFWQSATTAISTGRNRALKSALTRGF